MMLGFIVLFLGCVAFIALIYYSNQNIAKKEQEKNDLLVKAIHHKLGLIKPITRRDYYPIFIESSYENTPLTFDPNIAYEENIYGSSEYFFYEFLKSKSKYMEISWNSLRLKNYTPDFVIEEFKLIIEIDEPYTIKNKTAIHYIGADSGRDLSFKLAGWNIVKFSEFQIITQPEACCKFLGQAIDYLTKSKRFNNYFEDFQNINFDKQWTLEESLSFAKNNYRKIYLHLLPSID